MVDFYKLHQQRIPRTVLCQRSFFGIIFGKSEKKENRFQWEFFYHNNRSRMFIEL